MNHLKNSVRFYGYLGNAPEAKLTNSQNKVLLSLATHESKKTADGQRARETVLHNLVLWNKQADIAEKYLVKGSELTIEGRLTYPSYTDKDGVKRTAVENVVSDLLLPSKKQ